jgi:hypothetical protein
MGEALPGVVRLVRPLIRFLPHRGLRIPASAIAFVGTWCDREETDEANRPIASAAKHARNNSMGHERHAGLEVRMETNSIRAIDYMGPLRDFIGIVSDAIDNP